MVLAAGRGVRMRPLSDILPKPALPLPEGPVVGSALRLAASIGPRRLAVNTWHLADRMERALAEIDLPGITPSISREQQLMGTAGGLALARDRGLLGTDGAVLVLNGDSLVDLPLEPLLERFLSSRDLVTLAVIQHPDPARWSRVLLDPSCRVTAMHPPRTPPDNEPAAYHFLGVMVVSREALDTLPVAPGATPEMLWEPVRSTGRLGAAVVTGDWREVGTPADYLTAVRCQLGGHSVIDPSASAHGESRIVASYLGPHARTGRHSVITSSVLACGARVGIDARVTRSVLLGPVEVADGDTVTDEILVAPLQEL
jgi:NDP-sugar pyrophosphorylase family protein